MTWRNEQETPEPLFVERESQTVLGERAPGPECRVLLITQGCAGPALLGGDPGLAEQAYGDECLCSVVAPRSHASRPR